MKRTIAKGQVQHKYFAIPRSVDDGDGIVITSPAVDLYGDRVMPDGADLTGYMKNPIILWLHDAYGMTDSAGVPIGTAKSLEVVPGVGIRATGIDWLENDAFAARVKNAWDQGKIRAASIGFLPADDGWKPNDYGGYDFTKWRLLEFSLVPIPANPEAIRGGLSLVKSLGLDLFREPELIDKIVPANVSGKLADQGEAWTRPALQDFTDKAWGDLTDTEKRHIAGHFAWANQMPPDSYGDLKLPHHRASDGAVVLQGVAASWVRVDQTDGIDAAAVKAHLRAHYHAFGLQAPDERAAPAPAPKAGRVLSAKNLERLKQAAALIGDCIAEEEAEGDDMGDMGMAASTPTMKAPTPEAIRAAVAEAFTETVGQRGGA